MPLKDTLDNVSLYAHVMIISILSHKSRRKWTLEHFFAYDRKMSKNSIGVQSLLMWKNRLWKFEWNVEFFIYKITARISLRSILGRSTRKIRYFPILGWFMWSWWLQKMRKTTGAWFCGSVLSFSAWERWFIPALNFCSFLKFPRLAFRGRFFSESTRSSTWSLYLCKCITFSCTRGLTSTKTRWGKSAFKPNFNDRSFLL